MNDTTSDQDPSSPLDGSGVPADPMRAPNVPVVDPARVARYAEAILAEVRSEPSMPGYERLARAVVAVADEEHAPLVALAEAAEAKVEELQAELTEADTNAGKWMAKAAKVEGLGLGPAERMALTVARAQISRGEEPSPNVAAVCVMALDYLSAALADTPAEQRAEGGAWRDRHGDVWTEGEDGLLHTPETAPFSREHVEKKWGPLVPTEAQP